MMFAVIMNFKIEIRKEGGGGKKKKLLVEKILYFSIYHFWLCSFLSQFNFLKDYIKTILINEKITFFFVS